MVRMGFRTFLVYSKPQGDYSFVRNSDKCELVGPEPIPGSSKRVR